MKRRKWEDQSLLLLELRGCEGKGRRERDKEDKRWGFSAPHSPFSEPSLEQEERDFGAWEPQDLRSTCLGRRGGGLSSPEGCILQVSITSKVAQGKGSEGKDVTDASKTGLLTPSSHQSHSYSQGHEKAWSDTEMASGSRDLGWLQKSQITGHQPGPQTVAEAAAHFPKRPEEASSGLVGEGTGSHSPSHSVAQSGG